MDFSDAENLDRLLSIHSGSELRHQSKAHPRQSTPVTTHHPALQDMAHLPELHQETQHQGTGTSTVQTLPTACP